MAHLTAHRLAILLSLAAPAAANAAVEVTQDRNVVVVRNGTDVLKLSVCADGVVRVLASPDGKATGASPQQPWFSKPCEAQAVSLTDASGAGTGVNTALGEGVAAATAKVLKTGNLRISISLKDGTLTFLGPDDRILLQETGERPRIYEPLKLSDGSPAYKVTARFHPVLRQGIYGLGQHQSGQFNYHGATVRLAHANADIAHPLMMSTEGYGLLWNTASASTLDTRFPTEMTLEADVGQALDYLFIYGPEFDDVVARYRDMTGAAPLFPRWAYGLFQSMDRYGSGQDLLDVTKRYRDGKAPLDVIVQDWRWWSRMGDPEFRPDGYPDVPALLKTLNDRHVHTMISMWPLLSKTSQIHAMMTERGWLVPGTALYDPTNKDAADLYWSHFGSKLLAQGWDAFWLDGSEPELHLPTMAETDRTLNGRKLAIGPGELYGNVFPLAHVANVSDRWRKQREDKRVFILSRSSFAGVQRYGAASWSGDILNGFPVFQRQMQGGLNFALSGMPYWTTDIGGYYGGVLDNPPTGPSSEDPAFQELYVRWYQFGVFNPLFRTHGKRENNRNDLFAYGDKTPILLDYDRLRYRLMPYIYGLAWRVTDKADTIMRPLVMDWRTDERTWNIGDQFSFGPALMVAPITNAGQASRQVFLPGAAPWYDFWTGKKLAGGQWIDAAAPLKTIPVFAKAGAILPLGGVVEYADQDPQGPLELRVYAGADGKFELYDDAGDSYAYERGERAVTPLTWNDGARRLSIGARVGSFPGLVKDRTFKVVLIDGGRERVKTVRYDGSALEVGF
ncbi:TIM-barrel domain-containing protein [Caulobacter sp.]|uniref:TIM-barrel domain-containing protein n=1 Tax=Caulobacter sp. TaxID=78 RepID=UPI00161A6E61